MIRTLIHSYLISLLSYSLPFFIFRTEKLKAKFNHFLAEPARKVLGLPSFAPKHAIFATLRLPDIDSLQDICHLRLARKLLSFQLPHTMRARFDFSLAVKSSIAASRQPLGLLTRALLSRFPQLDLTKASNSTICSTVLSPYFSSYKSQHEVIAPFLPTDSPSRLPLYLMLDSRLVHCLRTRLRFICSYLADHHNKRNLRPFKPPLCPLCSTAPDNLSHYLLSCPYLISARHSSFPSLRRLSKHFPSLTFHDFIISACLDSLPSCSLRIHKKCIRTTQPFLLKLRDLRSL